MVSVRRPAGCTWDGTGIAPSLVQLGEPWAQLGEGMEAINDRFVGLRGHEPPRPFPGLSVLVSALRPVVEAAMSG
jgi:hypothetical protein